MLLKIDDLSVSFRNDVKMSQNAECFIRRHHFSFLILAFRSITGLCRLLAFPLYVAAVVVHIAGLKTHFLSFCHRIRKSILHTLPERINFSIRGLYRISCRTLETDQLRKSLNCFFFILFK